MKTLLLRDKTMFALFAGSYYYAIGGWNDYIGTYGTESEAVKVAAEEGCEWWHVVDLSTGDIVDES